MTEADGNPISGRRYSVRQFLSHPDDIERITIPPSTELIPDEYEHEDNKKGLVLIFSSKMDQENKQVLINAFQDQNYDVPVSNLFPVSTKEYVLTTLKSIAKENHEDRTCLILVFMANAEREDMLLPDEEKENTKSAISVRDIWSHFTADNCPSFKNKPKIFILQASKKMMVRTETDSAVISPPKGAYDIPAEADMLIVYKRIEHAFARNSFMVQLCNNFHSHGLKDDMIGLVTHTMHEDWIRPLIISTLTRKFYITPSSKRGHYYDLHRNHHEAISLLDKIQNTYKSKIEHKYAKKWQEAASGSAATSIDASITSPKPEPNLSKRVSRTTSRTSSVDSKKKAKVVASKKKPWKY